MCCANACGGGWGDGGGGEVVVTPISWLWTVCQTVMAAWVEQHGQLEEKITPITVFTSYAVSTLLELHRRIWEGNFLELEFVRCFG